ncbi:MAG: hypothetical protein ACYDAC_09435 [Candidatus Dormibacteria bacterium]
MLGLAGCAEVTVSSLTPPPAPSGVVLPPIGFSHRYGNTPVAARDGTQLERRLYSLREFWEVEILAEPVAVGYIDVGDAAAVVAARRATTSLTLVLASEERGTISGLLDTGSHAGQEAYVKAVLGLLQGLGYDHLRSATVDVYFSERDRHAQLTVSGRSYAYTVYDDDRPPAAIHIVAGGTPLPLPAPVTVTGG